MSKQKNVPALRFPGFKDFLVDVKIGEVIKRISKPVDVHLEESYNQIGVRSHGKGIFYKDSVTGKSLGNKRVFWLEEDLFIVNIVFAWEQAVAKTTLNEVGMIASHRFPMYRPLDGILDLDYLLFLFLTNKGKYLLETASPGGAGRNKTLGQKAFENLTIKIPQLSEQKKVSSFLLKIEKRIEILEQKEILLKQYKKAIAQRIFNKQISFKNSKDESFPDWNTVKLNEVLSMPVKIKPEKIDRDKIITVKLHLKGVRKSNNTKNLSLGATYYVRSKGQFIYGKQNLFNGSFGIVPPEFDNHLTSADIPSLDIDRSKINPNYLMQFLGRKSYYKKLEAIAIGTGSKRIHEKVLLNLKIDLPSLEEQNRIAFFLDQIDKRISFVTKQKMVSKKYKKSILQNMFL
ncbi:restriction endonuclease subunit S [Zhouia spongiae]|uniref:Restriction endonuclease subunit S n=1 Tax=Zhouia spongiae TaxID=2202721 RepID=A0ABY3YPU6_9FLAO|nr:restriction endonuclease subunit S [Zhouia spongiae]UNY99862.1 restriction endonuclease subunit S [Zhouia spongiae]